MGKLGQLLLAQRLGRVLYPSSPNFTIFPLSCSYQPGPTVTNPKTAMALKTTVTLID